MKPASSRPDMPPTDTSEYEAPCVETVLTADDVEREAHYGGNVSQG